MRLHVSITLHDFENGLDAALREGFRPEVRMADVEHMRRLDAASLSRMRARLDERDAGTFTHGPYLGLDIASLNDHIASYSAECLDRAVAATAALGGALMVIHTNYSPFFSRAGLREWMRNWSERMPPVIEAARALGVRVALENVWERTPEELARLLDALPRGAASVCIDTGHLAAFSRLPVARWWDRLGDRVAALHLHDNDGLSDDHLPPGSGIFDFSALAAILTGLPRLPLMTLEVDISRAAAGRAYLESLGMAANGSRREE
jgi:sugar phosphate isomerase/epimerase